MFLRSAFVLAAFLVATPAMAQPAPGNPQYQETVTLLGFDIASDTYNGQVSISANPCPDVRYSVGLGVSGVKNADDARDKVKAQVAKIAEDIRQAAAHCGSH